MDHGSIFDAINTNVSLQPLNLTEILNPPFQQHRDSGCSIIRENLVNWDRTLPPTARI